MKKLLLLFGAAFVFVMVYLSSSTPDALRQGEILQTGSVEVSNNTSYQHEVFYPEKFSSLPEVNIKFVSGSGYLEIVEQRLDGFVFKTSNLGYSEAEGARVEWRATGFIK